MDHAAARKGPRCVGVYQYFPYPSHKVGYQGFGVAFGTQIPRLLGQVHLGRNRILEHLLAQHSMPICCQDREKFLNRRSKTLDLGIRSKGKVPPNHKTKDKAKARRPRKTCQGHKQRKTLRSRRRTRESGVSSIRAPPTTQVSVGPSSHWWLN